MSKPECASKFELTVLYPADEETPARTWREGILGFDQSNIISHVLITIHVHSQQPNVLGGEWL